MNISFETKQRGKKRNLPRLAVVALSFLVITGFVFSKNSKKFSDWLPGNDKEVVVHSTVPEVSNKSADTVLKNDNTLVDTVLYQQKMAAILNGDSANRWPVNSSYPRAGAILPFKRIIAFYGNLYSKRMGILGELPPDEMLQKLTIEVNRWKLADSSIETVPALHYIATTAQSSPGNGKKYMMRMPFKHIDSIIGMASKIDALVFLDIQTALSSLESELPLLEPYLRMPNVHLGIDPEFAMKNGTVPGKAVGSFDAKDINYASDYLAKLVKEYNLPPKVLVVHRFTRGMVTNYKNIHTRPEVQLVMHMDGWGGPEKKLSTYQLHIHREPVQFTGFKIFYKNDTRDHNRLLTPGELLALKPKPVYIQYQ